jgi:hypothetical protein
LGQKLPGCRPRLPGGDRIDVGADLPSPANAANAGGEAVDGNCADPALHTRPATELWAGCGSSKQFVDKLLFKVVSCDRLAVLKSITVRGPCTTAQKQPAFDLGVERLERANQLVHFSPADASAVNDYEGDAITELLQSVVLAAWGRSHHVSQRATFENPR